MLCTIQQCTPYSSRNKAQNKQLSIDVDKLEQLFDFFEKEIAEYVQNRIFDFCSLNVES